MLPMKKSLIARSGRLVESKATIHLPTPMLTELSRQVIGGFCFDNERLWFDLGEYGRNPKYRPSNALAHRHRPLRLSRHPVHPHAVARGKVWVEKLRRPLPWEVS